VRRPVKDRDALDLVGEWLACNRADLCVVELGHLAGTRRTWRATLRTPLGRTRSELGISPGAALRATYDALGYVRLGDELRHLGDEFEQDLRDPRYVASIEASRRQMLAGRARDWRTA
jgi:hypothetical protein